MTDHAAFASESRFDSLIGTALDQVKILRVSGSCARVVSTFLNKHLFRADHFLELLREVSPWVDEVELHVTKCVPHNLFASRFLLSHDVSHTRALGKEDVYRVVLVELLAQASRFRFEVDAQLRHVNRMHVMTLAREADLRHPVAALLALMVFVCGVRCEPTTVAAHHFVHDKHAWAGIVLRHHVFEIVSPVLSRGVRAERLLDRVNVIVDRLRQADHAQSVVVLGQVSREIRSSRVGVVATDSVQHVHAVLHELVRSHLLWIFAFLHQTALHAILYIGELYAAVANRAATEEV